MPDPTDATVAPATTSRVAVGLVGVLLAMTLAAPIGACSSSGRPSATDSSPTTDTSSIDVDSAPPDTTADADTAVLAAYQEFWHVWLRANDPPNPDYPELTQVATGQELDTVRQSISKDLAAGNCTRLPSNSQYRHDATVISNIRGRAVVADCWIDDSQVRKRGSDLLVNSDVVTESILSELDTEGDKWLVSTVREQKESCGAGSCI